MSFWEMNLVVKLICLALVASALTHTTSAFATIDRSVKHCITTEQATPDKCNPICQAQLPKRSWTSPLRVAVESSDDGQTQCCCKYDDFWAIDEEDKFKSDSINKLFVNPNNCYRLFISRSSKEESKAYETMCLYLSTSTPLTMLELAEYIGAVSYLRSIDPKSSRIKAKINEIYIPKYTLDKHKLFEENLDSLLDHKRDKKHPSGPPFEVDQIEQLTKLTTTLREALDSGTAHRAFDELLISRVMISLIDAEKYYTEINRSFQGDSFELLRNGASVDPKDVDIKNFSCDKFIAIRDDLTKLYETSKSALSSLQIRVFNEMSWDWRPMSDIIKTTRVYNKVIEARCGESVANTSTE